MLSVRSGTTFGFAYMERLERNLRFCDGERPEPAIRDVSRRCAAVPQSCRSCATQHPTLERSAVRTFLPFVERPLSGRDRNSRFLPTYPKNCGLYH